MLVDEQRFQILMLLSSCEHAYANYNAAAVKKKAE